jgi:hypothetical protein
MTATPAFAEWQGRYAAHGVAIFPVAIADGDKRPAIRGWQHVGLRGAEQLVLKFADAQSFGFACGRRNRLTIVDMDSTDDAIVREGEQLFGRSPLLWRTGSGKFAAAYRFNGEDRRIRPIPALPIDLLGAGMCVAPPSAGTKRPYEIIRGSLADLDRLPVARLPDVLTRRRPGPNVDRIPDGKRGSELFVYAREVVWNCDDFDALLDAVRTWADGRLEGDYPDARIVSTCRSVWRWRDGRKRLMNGSFLSAEQLAHLQGNRDAMALLLWLALHNGPSAEFFVANGLTEILKFPLRALQAARRMLVELGIVICVRPASANGPALYRWAPMTRE